MKEGKSHKSKRRLTELTDQQREQAMARFIVLQPHLEEEVTLAEAARMAAVPIRTAQRWLSRYHAAGVNGLARSTRTDAGRPKLATDIVKLIEGLALRKPRLSIAAIHRKVANILEKRCEQPPSYSTVYAIIRQLDPAMIVLAQEGDPAFRDQFELVYRHRAERPNQIWQADHTLLDLLIVDANGKTVRPWLTSIRPKTNVRVTRGNCPQPGLATNSSQSIPQ